MPDPKTHEPFNPLLAEIRQAGFFQLNDDGQLQQQERISHLLADKATASQLLRGMLMQFAHNTNERNTMAEEQWGNHLLKVFELSVATPRQPELRATILARFAQLLGMRDQVYSLVGEAQARRNFDSVLVAQHQRILEALADLPQAHAGPDGCALLLDHAVRSLGSRPDGALPEPELALMGYLGEYVRKKMANNYYDGDYSSLDFAEYGTDTACVARTAAGRATAMRSSCFIIFRNSRVGESSFVHELQKTGERYEVDVNSAVVEALFDQAHPDARQAEAVVRKQLYLGYPTNTLITLLRYAETRGGRPIQLQYMDRISKLAADIFGEQGVAALHELQQHAIGSTPVNVYDNATKQLKRRSNLTIARWRKPDGHLQRYRVVEQLNPTSMQPDSIAMTEMTEHQQQTVVDYVTALYLDIQESTVALGETHTELCLPGNGTTWYVTTKPDSTKAFPACTLHIVSDKELFTLQLNDQLQFVPELRTDLVAKTKQALELCRSYAIAALHDQLSISHVTTVDQPTRPPAEKPPAGEPKPNKSPRVRRLKNLVVIAKGEQAEHMALSAIADPVTPTDLRLMVDRRPHWQDLAPDLTRQARLNVLADLQQVGLLDSCSDEQRALLHEALTGETAHLLSSRRIIEELAKRQKKDGTPVLPKTLPVAELLKRFQSMDPVETEGAATLEPSYKTEDDYYNAQLQEQDARGDESTIRFPGIFPVTRRDQITGEVKLYRPSVGQRLEADKIAMRDAGVDYQIPQRRLPTQTYVPFHRLAAIPVHDRVTQKKQYTIIRAESAVKALSALLEETVESTT